MRSPNYYRVRLIVRCLFWGAAALVALSIVWFISTRIWWTGDQFCIDTFTNCLMRGK